MPTLHGTRCTAGSNTPPGAATSLPDDQYLAALAYILHANGVPAGETLPGDEAALREIGFGE